MVTDQVLPVTTPVKVLSALRPLVSVMVRRTTWPDCTSSTVPVMVRAFWASVALSTQSSATGLITRFCGALVSSVMDVVVQEEVLPAASV